MAASRLDRTTTAPAWHLDGDRLNQDIFDALAGVCPQLAKWAATIASQHALPLSCVKAVHLLGTPLSMKELARRMHCDPSFVTVTADMLEERGLAKRESDAADRRIRNLVLTPRGHDLRQRLEQALLGQMPWDTALSVPERHSFLALLRKMGEPDRPVATSARGCRRRRGRAGGNAEQDDYGQGGEHGHDTRMPAVQPSRSRSAS